MALNVFGVGGGRAKPRKKAYAKQPFAVTVNGRVVTATRTRAEAEHIAKGQRRHVKTRGAVKVVKR